MVDKPLSLAQLEAIDAIVDRFEDQWDSGPPEINEFLDQLNDSGGDVRRALLVEVVAIDLDQRWRASATVAESQTEWNHASSDGKFPVRPLAENYADAYPELYDCDELPAEVIVAEYKVRRKYDNEPELDEYAQRFPAIFETLQPLLTGAQSNSRSEPISTNGETHDETFIAKDDAALGSALLGDFGDYHIESEIAAGGMGVVYRARHSQLNRNVALKMIKSGELASDQEVKRFRTEAEAAANLHHPNIVSIYEVGEFAGQHYYAMNFVDGQSLSEMVQDGPLPQKVAVEICEKTARAVAHAHAQGIIHRDLKPGNILLDADGDPKVTDFGLAKKVEGESELTITGQILGTPRFMAPEQAEGRSDIGPAADTYALGAILYFCLTGRAPFQAATVVDTLMQVREQEPVSPRVLNPEVDRDLETICLKCLQKDPARRYESATAFAEDLKRWQDREPILARPVSTLERFVKWVRRRPAVGAAIAASVLAMFALGALLSAASYNNELSRALDDAERAGDATEEALSDLSVEQSKTEAALAAAESANAEARRLSYYRNVSLAREEWDQGNPREMGRLLTLARNQSYGWEWKYLHTIYDSHSYSNRFQADIIHGAVGLSLLQQDQVAILSPRVIVHDLQRGETIVRWEDRETLRRRLSPDSKLVVGFTPNETTIKIWELRTGQLLDSMDCAVEIEPSTVIGDVTFTHDSSRILIQLQNPQGPPSEFVWWNWRSGSITLRKTPPGVKQRGYRPCRKTICLSPDGKLVAATTRQSQLLLLNAETGDEVWSLNTADQIDGDGYIYDLQFSSDGLQLATVQLSSVAIWDVETRELLKQFEHADVVGGLSFDMLGRFLITGCHDGIVRVWNLATGQLHADYRGHHAPILDVQMADDGVTLLSIDLYGYVHKWSLENIHQEFRQYSVPFSVDKVQFGQQNLAVYASGRTFGSNETSPPQLAIVDRDRRTVTSIATPANVERCLVASADGQHLVQSSWYSQLHIRDPQTGELLARFGKARPGLKNLQITPDGTAIVAGYYSSPGHPGRIAVWDRESQSLRFQHDVNGHVWDLDVHPDGNAVIASHGLGTGAEGVLALDIHSGEVVHESQLNQRRSVAFAPTGDRYAIVNTNQTIEIRSYPNDELIHSFNTQGVMVGDLAFTPDGNRLAAVTTGGVTLYDVVHPTRVLKLDHSLCQCLDFSDGGSYLVTGSADGTVRIWDASR